MEIIDCSANYHVKDVEKSVAWYEKIFKIKPDVDTGYAMFNVCGCKFSLIPAFGDETQEASPGNATIIFAVSDSFENIQKELDELGVEKWGEPRDIGPGLIQLVHDLDQNLLGVFTPKDFSEYHKH
jgi:predicted enzyme related to lactoylglutathione lyase